ncbi:MAG: polysaccharide pyruvyl transferase family protein [Cetobacterium sp.]
MKKIGLLSFSYGSNFGGTLQCLATYKVLKDIFKKDVKVLNYVPNKLYNFKSLYISGTKTKGKLDFKKLYTKLKYVKSGIDKFNNFREKELNMTEVLNEESFKIKAEEYTDLIVGSDQVWNVGGGFRGTYFFEDITGPNKISYAACSGSDYYQEKDKERLEKSIKDYNYISVRNKHTHNFVKRLTGKDAEVVCDPSILYDYKEYLTVEKPAEKYILTYILGSEIDGGHRKVLEEIKKKVGNVKIIAIGIAYAGSGSLQFYPWADKVLYDASPEDWLNLINNAEFIYTDSYHGVLFSMKFHKRFISYYAEKERASRFIDLAERYEVGDWIVNSTDEIARKNSIEKPVDYKKVDKLLDIHREYSMNFLKRALGERDE